MNAKLDQTQAQSAGDLAKFALALLVVGAGIFGFYWFEQWPTVLRGFGLVVTLLIAGVIALFTAKGRAFREYVSESRFELRKVVWPTRQETLRSTGLILLVVVIISILLAGIDFVLGSAVRALLS